MTKLEYSKVNNREGSYKSELIVIEESKLTKTPPFAKTWSEAAVKQFVEHLRDFKLEDAPPYKTLKVAFESGKTVFILPLPAKIKTFDLHQSLRDGFTQPLAEETVLVDASFLRKELQSTVIGGIVSLAVLSAWKAPTFKKKQETDKTQKKRRLSFLTLLTPKELSDLASESAGLAESNNLVRTLAETPSNYLKPNHYHELLKTRAKDGGYDFKFYGIRELEKIKAGAFLAVAKGDPDNLGGIAHLKYKPKIKAKKRIALVGKGICFDTGGYNVKTGSHMYGMHRDMTGSAVALALFEFLVRQKAPYEVDAYLAIAENLISPHALRPNDLLVASNGTSIEMIDTDAEGRLVLSDTLVMASKTQPDIVMDFATLTGSAVRALDTRRAAIFSNNEKLLRKGYEIGETSGERTWGFPIGEDYMTKLKSDVADIKQCNPLPGADHIYAASFLSTFVEKGVDWIHMDLSTDTCPGGLGLVSTETTGFGVRWGYELIKSL